MKKSRTFRAGLDSLEPRSVLSTVSLAAQVLPLRGVGTLTSSAGTTLPDGGTQATVTLSGDVSRIGSVTGTLVTDVAAGNLSFTASGPITAPDGDQIDISFSGSNQTVHPHQSLASARFRFTVTGGTGAYSGSTGGGTIKVVQNVQTGVEVFTMNGTLRG